MKYLAFTALIIWISPSMAQGNLQFNQVKMISNTDAPQTVPAGKVWKITPNSISSCKRYLLGSLEFKESEARE